MPRVVARLCLRRHIHEAVAADTGRAVERVDPWTFHAKRMPSSIRRPMYRITGHYPMMPSGTSAPRPFQQLSGYRCSLDPYGFVNTIRSGTMVYEERTGSGTGSQEVHPGYRDEAVELVISSGRPIAEIARNLGINEGTLANWVNTAKKSGKLKEKPLDTDERAELRSFVTRTGGCGWSGIS